LEGRYVVLMRRVEELAALPNRSERLLFLPARFQVRGLFRSISLRDFSRAIGCHILPEHGSWASRSPIQRVAMKCAFANGLQEVSSSEWPRRTML
jgi:hypothetical protein